MNRPIPVPSKLVSSLEGGYGTKTAFVKVALNAILPSLDTELYFKVKLSLEQPLKGKLHLNLAPLQEQIKEKQAQLKQQGLEVGVNDLIRVAVMAYAEKVNLFN